MRISDWSSDVCSSDLDLAALPGRPGSGSRRLADAAASFHLFARRPADARHRVLLQRYFRLRHRQAGRAHTFSPADHPPAKPEERLLVCAGPTAGMRPGSEAHTTEFPALLLISYAVLPLLKPQI